MYWPFIQFSFVILALFIAVWVICSYLLDDAAVFHHQNRVGVTNGRQPVRDDERRSSAHQLAHGALDEDFGARVDAIEIESNLVGALPIDGDAVALRAGAEFGDAGHEFGEIKASALGKNYPLALASSDPLEEQD